MSTENPMKSAVDNHDWQDIASHSFSIGCPGIVGDLIRHYPQFTRWSGSHSPQLHHYGNGGLVKHTREVINIGLQNALYLKLDMKFDLMEYFLAALFHDTGKMFDYEMVDQHISCDDTVIPVGFQSSHHKRIIHHVSRSGLIWHDAVQKYPELNEKYHDKVYHAILAHHGRREWGSPVAPFSHVAWMLHLADGISARMNDADKIDHLKIDHGKA